MHTHTHTQVAVGFKQLTVHLEETKGGPVDSVGFRNQELFHCDCMELIHPS